VSDYEHCLHTEHTGQKRLVRPVEEPSNNADNEDNFERSENITELVSSDSVVAVKAEDDNIEYYMLKVTSGLETLSTTEKDSWGVEYPSGFQIFRGNYYDNSRKDPLNIQINSKKTSHCSCIISFVYLCRC
jgi:hypothetical protein